MNVKTVLCGKELKGLSEDNLAIEDKKMVIKGLSERFSESMSKEVSICILSSEDIDNDYQERVFCYADEERSMNMFELLYNGMERSEVRFTFQDTEEMLKKFQQVLDILKENQSFIND